MENKFAIKNKSCYKILHIICSTPGRIYKSGKNYIIVIGYNKLHPA